MSKSKRIARFIESDSTSDFKYIEIFQLKGKRSQYIKKEHDTVIFQDSNVGLHVEKVVKTWSL